MRLWTVSLLAIVMAMTASCGGNMFSSIVNPQSYGDQAIYDQMVIDMNKSSWDAALTDYGRLSGGYSAQRSVQELYAGALAGKCGFDFLGFFNTLSTANPGFGAGLSPIFLWLMQAYQNTSVTMNFPSVAAAAASGTFDTYCSASQQVMDNIKTKYGSWSSDEQVFVAVYNFAKIGIVLKYWMDSAGAGVPVATTDICLNSGVNGIPDFYINQVVTGFSLFVQNIAAISGVSGSIAVVNAACALISGLPGVTICSDYTPADVTPADRKTMRSILTMEDSGTNPGNALSGMGLIPFASAAPVAATDPTGNLWQCDGSTGIQNCCP